VRALLPDATLGSEARHRARALARDLAGKVRAERRDATGADALMHAFALSSEEGVALMCLAEALLRIPDAATADALIRDKIGGGDWRAHAGLSDSMFVNATCWALLVTGKLVTRTPDASALSRALSGALARVASRRCAPRCAPRCASSASSSCSARRWRKRSSARGCARPRATAIRTTCSARPR